MADYEDRYGVNGEGVDNNDGSFFPQPRNSVGSPDDFVDSKSQV